MNAIAVERAPYARTAWWRNTRAHLLFERNLMVYRRSWLTLISGFFEPLFYLFSLGIGLGHFVGPCTACRTRATSRRRCSRRRR